MEESTAKVGTDC